MKRSDFRSQILEATRVCFQTRIEGRNDALELFPLVRFRIDPPWQLSSMGRGNADANDIGGFGMIHCSVRTASLLLERQVGLALGGEDMRMMSETI